MNSFLSQLAAIFRYDPGNRGLPAAAPEPELARLLQSLAGAENTLVLTGFPVLKAGAGETDGPCGAVNIARALHMLGKRVSLITDEINAGIVRAAADALEPELPLICIPHTGAREACINVLEREMPTHIIAIERPGKHGGHFYSMRGQILDELVADTDALFSQFDGVKIAIGDGGNELGMGSLRESVLASVPNGEQIIADQGCDFPLAAGVSNWWGWGIAALLSVQAGRDLLPTDEQEDALLAACVRAHAVDGMSALCEHRVDGLSFEQNIEVLARIRELVHSQLYTPVGGNV